MLLAILTVVCIITYTVEITFGLAGTIMMLMVMSFLMETKTLVIFSLMPQIMVAVIGLARSPKTVELKYLGNMLAFAVLGSFLGLYLFYAFPPTIFQIGLASMITLSGLYLVLAPGRLRIGPLTARVLDTTAGTSQALFGISGPIAMTRLLGSFDEKTLVRNYALAFFLSLNLFRAAGYVVNGTISAEIGRMMLVVAPFLAVAMWYSNHLHFRINERMFRRVVAWLILVGGISLFLH